MAQLGTIKLQTQNSGVVDVPVFAPGDSGSGIYEFVRVQTASGTGFIPVTDTSSAAYPYLRVQSQNNGIVAVTDTASAIPDSAVAQFNAKELTGLSDGDTVSTWPELVLGNDATGSGIYRPSAINGNPAVEFNGVDDSYTAPIGSYSQKNVIYTVAELTDTGANHIIVDGGVDGNSHRVFYRSDDDIYRIAAGDFNDIQGGNSSTILITSVFDTTNSLIRTDGVEGTIGDAGNESLNDLSIGIGDFGGEHYEGYISFVEIHNGDVSTGLQNREQQIADMFDITI